jgi:hypothetical protein
MAVCGVRDRSAALRVVGPDEPDTAYLAYHEFQGERFAERVFGVVRAGQGLTDALQANGFELRPRFAFGIGLRAVIYETDAQPAEYLVALSFPGDEPEEWPRLIYVPGLPELLVLLCRGDLTTLAALFEATSSGLRVIDRRAS